jgi:hypothetical protein
MFIIDGKLAAVFDSARPPATDKTRELVTGRIDGFS